MKETLDDLATAWFNNKAEVAKLDKARLDIEQKICTLTDAKPEGSKTDKTTRWKVTTTGKLNVSFDVAGFDKIAASIPAEFHPVKTERKLDPAGLKWLAENRPEIHSKVMKFVTTTPAKTAVKCEPLSLEA
jgi:hypothetical protein